MTRSATDIHQQMHKTTGRVETLQETGEPMADTSDVRCT
jgi:hypothetical protein